MPGLEDLEKRVWRQLAILESRIENEIIRNMRDALDKLRLSMSKIYEKYSKDGVLTKAEMTKYNRMEVMYKQLSEDLLPALGQSASQVRKLQKSQYSESFFRHAWAIDNASGVALKWGLLSPEMIKAAVENEFSKIAIKGVRQNGLLGIRRAVTSGLIQGDSYPKMAKKIKHFMDFTASSYQTIVRTEGQRSAVLGQQATYDKAENLGVEMQRIWDATLDSRTRTSHGKLDGVPAKHDEGGYYWNSDVGRIAGPLQSGIARWDCNCRCRTRGQIAGYEPKVRRIRDEGIKPYITYKEWKKKQ